MCPISGADLTPVVTAIPCGTTGLYENHVRISRGIFGLHACQNFVYDAPPTIFHLNNKTRKYALKAGLGDLLTGGGSTECPPPNVNQETQYVQRFPTCAHQRHLPSTPPARSSHSFCNLRRPPSVSRRFVTSKLFTRACPLLLLRPRQTFQHPKRGRPTIAGKLTEPTNDILFVVGLGVGLW